MIRADRTEDDIQIMYTGDYSKLVDEATGIMGWIVRHIKSEDIASIVAAIYEYCQEDPQLQRVWDEAEFLFEDNRRQSWNDVFLK